MHRGAALLAASAAFLGIAPCAAAAIEPSVPLASRLSDVATHFCVDALSRKVPLAADLSTEAALMASHGLSAGLPNEAMTALGRDVTLVAQATLASGKGSDGAFMVAIGGRVGPSCRLVVYGAPLDGLFVQATYQAMQRPDQGWRKLPVPAQPANALKLSLIRRDSKGQAFLANILAPVTPGPISAVISVAAIPPSVVIPEGY